MEVNIFKYFCTTFKKCNLQMNKKIFSFIFYKIDGASFPSFAMMGVGLYRK
jgi:hypothetical protein